MPESLEARIVQALTVRPGMTAKDLAAALGADKALINRALYGPLAKRFTQDAKYRWAPAAQQAPRQAEAGAGLVDTPLARLSRYYLSCIGQDDEGGVSTFAFNQYGSPDYCELSALSNGDSSVMFQSREAQRLVAAVRSDRGRTAMYFGYPVSLVKHKARSGWEGFFVQPLVLIPVEFDDGSHGQPRLAQGFPIINLKALRHLAGMGQDGLMEELVQLEAELGLTGESDIPELDELVQRLAAVRPEWRWQEPCDPGALGTAPPLSSARDGGIYNRALLVMAERSPYTVGLESELKRLAQLGEKAYSNTALGQWIDGALADPPNAREATLVEVMPLNTEQRQAVHQALVNPLTIITGPPGTGKSQVVADLLINAAWQGTRVLFASKNNKAVDVVEVRVNNLGPRPVLIRVGSNTYQTRLAEYLLGLLAATATQEDRRVYDELLASQKALEARDAELAHRQDEVIALRNRVDQAEQEVETIRSELGPAIFAALRTVDLSATAIASKSFEHLARVADRAAQPLLQRLFWPLVRKARLGALSKIAGSVASIATLLRIPLPAAPPDDASISIWRSAARGLRDRLALAAQVQSYFHALKALQQKTALEQLEKQRGELTAAMSANAERLWNAWLRLQPTKLSPADRQLLHKYNAVLKMVIDAGSVGTLTKEVYREYSALFPKIAHILPCWAVTSLSAKGRIPFEPGFFDLVVFDESSQCDIASALPLLYRAKRAAVIGDPKQLSHISGLPKGQDQKLLDRHGLLQQFPHWAYSYNSLFDLASSCARSEDIVSLRDHHRSHSDVIDFSNQFFYEGRLRVATRYNLLRRPVGEATGVRWIDVPGRVVRPASGGALNHSEAEAVVEELRRLVLQRGYEGTVGVVSPFRAQANLIREMVSANARLEEELTRREFLSDTVHKFQGDERDVMIFSPVVSHGITAGGLGFLRSNGNLFNVAITRARAMLLVVGDLTAAANCEVDYLRQFALYTQNLHRMQSKQGNAAKAELGEQYPAVANPEQVSDWEKVLYTALFQAGLRTIPQYQVEKYALDLALIIDDTRRLDIEVDGERYHRAWNGELCRRDQLRNQRLFELGWDVMRFWVYEIRDDLEGCVGRVGTWKATGLAKAPLGTTLPINRTA